MANITLSAPLVDGSLMPYIGENHSCEEIVSFVCSDDCGPPPQSVLITVKTESGKLVEISIPNETDAIARVTVDGKAI
ncbi:hypothetical protein [Uliginosibacterium gangwonense]|uniref:hypothetical protein n=1 Tax=Uliginosibacterium gangwonense TaxID=392736 RepID=UPI000A3094DA|nr:hypothetical protein [Uliginosibacterium gangwonense]